MVLEEHSQRRTSNVPPEPRKPRRGTSFGSNETNATTVTSDYGLEEELPQPRQPRRIKSLFGRRGSCTGNIETNATSDYGYEDAQPQPRRRVSLFGDLSGDSHALKPRRASFFGSSGGQQRRDSGSKRRSRNKKSNEEGELANDVLAAFCDFEE
jgi:hypothetical protein